MMNEQARKIFSELLDANYEFTNLQEDMDTGKQVDLTQVFSLGKKVSDLRGQFKEAMGLDAYNEFMRQGAEMFAPAK
jgi:hypothetical protein